MLRPALTAITTTAALAITACGTTSDQDQVRGAVKTWMTELAAGHGRKACAMLTPAARRAFVAQFGAFAPPTCPALVEQIADGLPADQRDALPRIAIHRVILADRASKAIIEDEDVTLPDALARDGDARPTVLRRIDGRWKLEDLG